MNHVELGRRAAKAAWRSLIREVGADEATDVVLTERSEVLSLAVAHCDHDLPDEPPGYRTVEYGEAFVSELEQLAHDTEDDVLNNHTTVGSR